MYLKFAVGESLFSILHDLTPFRFRWFGEFQVRDIFFNSNHR